MKYFKLLFGVQFLLCSLAYADGALGEKIKGSPQTGSGSHGGKGVRLNGQLYLSDLRQVGAHISPRFEDPVNLDPQIIETFEKRLFKVMRGLNLAEIKLLALKLAEIHELDALSAWSALKGIEMLKWYPVPGPLNKTPDGSTIFLQPDEVQIALRKGITVAIDDILYPELANDGNRSALATHEVAYAINPVFVDRVREFNGYIHKERLLDLGKKDFHTALRVNEYISILPLDKGTYNEINNRDVYNFKINPESEIEIHANRFNGFVHKWGEERWKPTWREGRGAVAEKGEHLLYNPAVMLSSYGSNPDTDKEKSQVINVLIYKRENFDEKTKKLNAFCAAMAKDTPVTKVFSYRSYEILTLSREQSSQKKEDATLEYFDRLQWRETGLQAEQAISHHLLWPQKSTKKLPQKENSLEFCPKQLFELANKRLNEEFEEFY